MRAWIDLGLVVLRVSPTYFFDEARHLVCLVLEAPVSTTVCLECDPLGCDVWNGARVNPLLEDYPVHHHHEELDD